MTGFGNDNREGWAATIPQPMEIDAGAEAALDCEKCVSEEHLGLHRALGDRRPRSLHAEENTQATFRQNRLCGRIEPRKLICM